MTRPATDLGLWTACVAAPFLFVGGAIALDVWGRGWTAEVPGWLIGTVAGSLFIGGGMYDGLKRAGWRFSWRRPDQAEDYGDQE